jgi:hypothetical protein
VRRRYLVVVPRPMPTSASSNDFCAIWVCISSSSSSRGAAQGLDRGA